MITRASRPKKKQNKNKIHEIVKWNEMHTYSTRVANACQMSDVVVL